MNELEIETTEEEDEAWLILTEEQEARIKAKEAQPTS